MATLEYGWRLSEFSVCRGGFYACVERFWCTPDDEGWRWSGFGTDRYGNPAEPRHMIGDSMPLVEAMAAADAWITEQIAAAATVNVYAFAGAEVGPTQTQKQPVAVEAQQWAPDGMIDGGYDAGPVKEDR